MNMSKRERVLALLILLIGGGWALMNWVVDPVLAAFDRVDAEAVQLEAELQRARALIDNEEKLRRDWVGFERAGLSLTAEQADAQTGGALFAWAEDAGFDKINLSDGRPRTDDEQPFGVLTYTLQTTGSLQQVCDLIWSIRQSPFPLRLEKCVIDLRNDEQQSLSLSLTVSTLFTPEEATP